MNVEFGYRCASEEHPAQVLLRNAQTAENLGLTLLSQAITFILGFTPMVIQLLL
jgi:hypothetical protein